MFMGFFPDHLTMDKIDKNNFSMLAPEFVQGFRYVRHYMTHVETSNYFPLTWNASEMVAMGRLERISKSFVFGTEEPLKESDREEGEISEEPVVETVSNKRKDESKPGARKKQKASKDTADNPSASKGKSAAKEKAPPKPKPPPKQKAATKSKAAAKTPASNAAIVVHLSDDEDIEMPEESMVLEGREVLQLMEKYYTFGINSIFHFPVELILPAPARLCYRMMNRDHVKQIIDSMIANPGLDPQIADLIPYNTALKKLVSYSGSEVDRKDLLAAIAK
ncbi:unnamed protein product [Calypogeia fissa]